MNSSVRIGLTCWSDSRETEREIPLLVKYSNNEYQNEKTGVIEDFNEE